MDNLSSHNVTGAIKTLKAARMALDDVEVKGSTNMNILLGSMQAMERSINIIDNAFRELIAPPVKQEEEAPKE